MTCAKLATQSIPEMGTQYAETVTENPEKGTERAEMVTIGSAKDTI